MSKMYDYHTIIVGTDGSPLAAPTVARAAWLAAHNDADLVIVCAYAQLTPRQEARAVAAVGEPPVGQVLGRTAASSAIADAVAAAQEQGATISAALLVDGEPATALLSTAKERAAVSAITSQNRGWTIASPPVSDRKSVPARRRSPSRRRISSHVSSADAAGIGFPRSKL